VGCMITLGLTRLAVNLTRPYRVPWDRTGREFARWFWEELGADAELVCAQTDLGIAFRPEGWAYDGADQYLCYQRIYSARHRNGRPPRWDLVSSARPLRCVLLNRGPQDFPAFRRWLIAQSHHYTCREIRAYTATRGS